MKDLRIAWRKFRSINDSLEDMQEIGAEEHAPRADFSAFSLEPRRRQL